MRDFDIDLGDGHRLKFIQWAPQRDINPQYEGIPDVEKFCAAIYHLSPNGEECRGRVTFDGPIQRQVHPLIDKWTVERWDPLTISPSVLCECGDHGFLERGVWRRA